VERFAEITLGMPALNGLDRAAYPYADVFDFNASRALIRPPAMKRVLVPAATLRKLREHPGLSKRDQDDPS
jgi:hypothetical protein